MDKIVLVHLVTVVYNAGGATSRIGAKQSSFKVISTVKNSCSFQQQHEPPATAKLPAPKVTLVTAAVAACTVVAALGGANCRLVLIRNDKKLVLFFLI